MTHTRPMEESEGTFEEGWTASDFPCRCGARTVQYRVWESSCGGYEDTKYRCTTCGHVWWVDGPDA